MPFIKKGMAFQLLSSMSKGTCTGSCRQVWLRNIQYALKTPTNPLNLTAAERKQMEAMISVVKGGRSKRVTQKLSRKYKKRPSPPLPANEHCGETKKGNDGQMYVSVPNKKAVCRWTLKR
jgi:hypothetical protein